MENVQDLEREYQRCKTTASEAYERMKDAHSDLAEISLAAESLVQQVLSHERSPADLELRVWLVCRVRDIAEEAARTKAADWDKLRERVSKLLVRINFQHRRKPSSPLIPQ